MAFSPATDATSFDGRHFSDLTADEKQSVHVDSGSPELDPGATAFSWRDRGTERRYVVTVADSGTADTITISPTTVPAGVVGTAYTATTFTASGGTAPYTWAETGAIDGLTLSSAGVLSGTPTAAGTFPFSVSATDSENAKVTENLSLTVTAS